MKPKILLHITIFCLISVFSALSAFALPALGLNPFYHTHLGSEDEMKSMLLDNRDDVREGLRKAGDEELYEPLIAQLPDAEVETVEYRPGQTFPWMFYRKDGRGNVRIDKDVVWEGAEPFSSYNFTIDHQGQRYTFTVPPICGNLTFVGAGPIPAAAPMAVAPPAVTEEPVQRPVEEPMPVAAARRFPILVDVGYLYQMDPGHYLLARIGMEFPLTEEFSIIGMIGGAPHISGSDGDDAFIADVFANYSFSRFFVGLGLGAWLTSGDSDLDSEDDDLDLIVNIGSRIFGDPDGFNTSVFLEARSGIDELDEFDLYGRIGAGLRFRF